MLPLLKLTADRAEHSVSDARDQLAAEFDLTQEERSALLPSGKQPVFDNRVGWAKTYLQQAGLLESTRRAYFRITDAGVIKLGENPREITAQSLEAIPQFAAFRNAGRGNSEPQEHVALVSQTQTPEEILDNAFRNLKDQLASELLVQVKSASPNFFERLVVDVLTSMGYGGSWKAGTAVVGKPGDEGIDGMINEDRLGLDVIYIQAKRWEGVVGRPEIQKFVGALAGRRAKKGVFMTTSSFTGEAKSYVDTIEPKVVLVDGRRLAELMIEFGVGVATRSVYETKRIDSDYFSEE